MTWNKKKYKKYYVTRLPLDGNVSEIKLQLARSYAPKKKNVS